MSKVLFNLLGFDIRGKDLVRLLGIIVVALVVWKCYDIVRDHFNHISDLEASNASLTSERDNLETQMNTAIEVNKSNDRVAGVQAQLRDMSDTIAAGERKAAADRAAQQKEIANAIKSSRPANDSRTVEPVAPVILDVTDRLWGQGGLDTPAAGRSQD